MIGYIVMKSYPFEGIVNDGGTYKVYLDQIEADAKADKVRGGSAHHVHGLPAGEVIKVELPTDERIQGAESVLANAYKSGHKNNWRGFVSHALNILREER